MDETTCDFEFPEMYPEFLPPDAPSSIPCAWTAIAKIECFSHPMCQDEEDAQANGEWPVIAACDAHLNDLLEALVQDRSVYRLHVRFPEREIEHYPVSP